MKSLDQIKLRLKQFFTSRFNGTLITIVKVEVKNNKVVVFFKNKGSDRINSAASNDGFSFADAQESYETPETYPDYPHACPVLQTSGEKEYLYFGERSINLAYKTNGDWNKKSDPLISASNPLETAAVFKQDHGLLLLYYQKSIEDGITYYAAHMALFDKENPEMVLWHTEEPIWKHKDVWQHKKAKPVGAILHNKQVITYWMVDEKILFGVVLSGFVYDPKGIHKIKIALKKHHANPIIAPRPENEWEAFTTFNPAAVCVDNKVHLVYRAQGFDYISTFGYAVSHDGVHINSRLPQPIYTPTMDFENNYTGKVNPDLMSGGGYGGCEDPRVTLLGDRVYITYVAFNGWSSVRLALTSISVEDFLNQRWNWTKPVLISRPGVIDKSGCLLPEKINGKYVFFHRVFPNILIDYVDDLAFKGKGAYLKNQYQIPVRKDKWDSRKIGVGAPPLKTKDGWLLIYYGVDNRDASKYHIGAMILDLHDPTKVLYRCDEPILQPTEEYENMGFKPGIAYPCGAVIVKDTLLVYYGGADTVVCVAAAPLDTFLRELKSHKPIHLQPIVIKEVSYEL